MKNGMKKGEALVLTFGVMIASALIGAGISLLGAHVFSVEYRSLYFPVTGPIFVAGVWMVLWPHKQNEKFSQMLMALFAISMSTAICAMVISLIIGSMTHDTDMFLPSFLVAWGILFAAFVVAVIIPRVRSRSQQGSKTET